MTRRGFDVTLYATALDVQCTVFDGERIMHSAAAPIVGGDIAAAAATAVRSVRLSSRATALLVLDALWCQVRTLRGLPKPRTQRDQQELLRQNAATFFLRLGGPMLIPAPRWQGDASAVGCAFAETTVSAVRRALSEVRVSLRAVAPVQALPEFSIEATRLLKVGDPLVYALEDQRDFRSMLPVSLGTAVAAVLLAFTAPAVAARQASHLFAAELNSPDRVAIPVAGSDRSVIARRSAAIRALFRGQRSPTLQLAMVADALAADVRVEALRIDSASTAVTLTTTGLDDVMTRLERMERGVSVDITGQVSRQPGSEGEERVTVLIRWPNGNPGSNR